MWRFNLLFCNLSILFKSIIFFNEKLALLDSDNLAKSKELMFVNNSSCHSLKRPVKVKSTANKSEAEISFSTFSLNIEEFPAL